MQCYDFFQYRVVICSIFEKHNCCPILVILAENDLNCFIQYATNARFIALVLYWKWLHLFSQTGFTGNVFCCFSHGSTVHGTWTCFHLKERGHKTRLQSVFKAKTKTQIHPLGTWLSNWKLSSFLAEVTVNDRNTLSSSPRNNWNILLLDGLFSHSWHIYMYACCSYSKRHPAKIWLYNALYGCATMIKK